MEARYQRIQRVLFIALGINLVLAVGKLLLGWSLDSLSVMSDGVHSVMDGAGSVVGLIAIHVASLPADPRHPYGHRKFEVLGTLVLAGLLLLSCWEIIGSAFARMVRPSPMPDFSWGGLLFLLSTLGVNFWLSRYEAGKAAELDSPILAADAAHTRSDVFTTLLACVGLFTARIGWPLLDAVCAVLIVGFIAKAAYHIIIESVDTVADANRLDPAEVRRVVEAVAGVHGAHEIRSHGMSNDIHIDLHLRVDTTISAREVFEIGKKVGEALKQHFPGISQIGIRHEPTDIRQEEEL
jgi:cation diffusion facilitator family transporter